MQHMGDDGSHESEHEAEGGFPGEQVTPRSRLMADERIVGRQRGASQTEAIDEVDPFKTYKRRMTSANGQSKHADGPRLRREATHALG